MFNPWDWYWVRENGQVYSSARGREYAPSNDVYRGWLSNGNNPTPYPRDTAGNESEAELAAVLAPYGIVMGSNGLEAVKTAAKTTVDAAAEQARLKYITPGSGQAMTYQQKTDEARRFLAGEEGPFPMLEAEVSITAPDLAGVVDVIMSAFTQWQHVGAAIEAERLGSKAAIDAAETEEAVAAIVKELEWP